LFGLRWCNLFPTIMNARNMCSIVTKYMYLYIIFLFFFSRDRIAIFALSHNELKPKSSRNPQDFRWKLTLGSANRCFWQIVNVFYKWTLLKRYIDWLCEHYKKSRLHFQLLLHCKIVQKICSFQFPYLFLGQLEWVLFDNKIGKFGPFYESGFRPPMCVNSEGCS